MKKTDRIIYGTMRMHETKRSLSNWVYIFDEMYEKGIFNFHISKEYKSYNLFLDVIRKSRYKNKDFNVYAKCFSPNFQEEKFNKINLVSLLNKYLNDIKISKINMQWMWRGDLDNDHQRCINFEEKIDQINSSFLQLKKNKINKIFCFPYSLDFGKLVKKIKSIDGLTIYYNPNEQSYKKILGKDNIGIRPLYSGKLTKKYSFKYLMNYSLKEKNISKIMLSINKMKNFKELYSFLNV